MYFSDFTAKPANLHTTLHILKPRPVSLIALRLSRIVPQPLEHTRQRFAYPCRGLRWRLYLYHWLRLCVSRQEAASKAGE